MCCVAVEVKAKIEAFKEEKLKGTKKEFVQTIEGVQNQDTDVMDTSQ